MRNLQLQHLVGYWRLIIRYAHLKKWDITIKTSRVTINGPIGTHTRRTNPELIFCAAAIRFRQNATMFIDRIKIRSLCHNCGYLGLA